MSDLQLVAVGVMTVLSGLAILVAAFRPAPPRLETVLAQLNAQPARTSARGPQQPLSTPAPRWLPPSLVVFADRHLSAADEDLEILGRSRAQLALTKIGWAIGGTLLPAVFVAILAAGGFRLPFTIPVAASLILALLAWVNPSRQVAEDAEQARTEFRAALAAFLALVGLERKARGSPPEALEEASRVSGARPFVLIHTEVLRAELENRQPWDALRDLGHRIGVDELVNLADIVSTAADGAAIFDTLMAEARSMRHADVTAQQTQAALANERLTLPTVCLFVCFGALLVYPAAVRLVGG